MTNHFGKYFFGFFSAVLVACFHGLCQESATSAGDFHLRAEVRLANVDVAVMNKRSGKPIDNLTQSDFHVTDNGREQAITRFSKVGADSRPLSLVLVVETAHSEAGTLKSIADSAEAALKASLRADDQVAVVNSFPSYKLVSDFTKDRQKTAAALRDLADESAARNAPTVHKDRAEIVKEWDAEQAAREEAVRSACDLVADQRDFRAEVIFITNDLNWTLRTEAEQNAERLLRTGIGVNALIHATTGISLAKFALRAASNKERIPNEAEFYATQTGGIALSIGEKEFPRGLERLLTSITASYSLAWKPSDSGEGFHKIVVRVANDGSATVRAKSGYYIGDGAKSSEQAHLAKGERLP